MMVFINWLYIYKKVCDFMLMFRVNLQLVLLLIMLFLCIYTYFLNLIKLKYQVQFILDFAVKVVPSFTLNFSKKYFLRALTKKMYFPAIGRFHRCCMRQSKEHFLLKYMCQI